jgi:predicted amidophosphoribosyltransferase
VEISRPLSRRFGIPIELDLVERQVHTVAQVGLTPSQRRANLRRAFRCTLLEVPASVAIVDDVITSGSTVSEVARCLRRAGVERIAVWALTHV